MRKMVEIPHASLTYQDGLSAVTTGPFGSTIVGYSFYSFSFLSFLFCFSLELNDGFLLFTS